MSFSNIKNLIYKDLRLLMHPTIYIFYALAAGMLFIPSYPRMVCFLYLLIGILNIFTFSLQYKDHAACGLIPVKKRETVLARIGVIAALQLSQLIFTAPFAFTASRLLAKWDASNTAGMNINITLYALVLIGYSAYNIIVIPGAYHKQFKVNFRFFIGILAFSIITAGLENLVCRPQGGRLYLNGTQSAELIRQIPFLIGALILYFAVNYITFVIASRRYEKAEV